MKSWFVPRAPYRLSSLCNSVALGFGIACLVFTMMTLSNGGRSRTMPAHRIATPPQHGGLAYHVSPTGSDSNPGSEARPFRTIQKAADSVKPGDTVLIDDGVYNYSGPNDCYGKVVVCVSRGGAPSTGGMKVSDSTIANNIFYVVNSAAIWIGGESRKEPLRFVNVRISNNIISNGVLLSTEENIDASGLILAGNLEKTDPKFAGPAAFDFHLRSDSPAIDVGLALSGVANDYDGRVRPRGGGVDIGAYEMR